MFAQPAGRTLVIVLVIVLLFFGPKRLPALSRSIGESVKEFKGGITHGASRRTSPSFRPAPAAASTTGSTSERGADQHRHL